MNILRHTRSLCPICLRPLPALLAEEDGGVYLKKTCPEHGDFSVILWRGLTDFREWRVDALPLADGEGLSCPRDCGSCSAHPQQSCCVLLEVTRRCNLSCSFCFAHGEQAEPSLEELKNSVDIILSENKPLIQLSGGEPSLRNDLPELIAHIRAKGGKYVQLNSNGLRLAEDEAYVKALADAGLSFVFMQFDGVDEEIYRTLRGKDLLETKKKAIENCGKYGLGVTLVPTLVRGVNEHQVGDIIRFGAERSPVVRGVHFQPVSYFGRYPALPNNPQRYTLDELIHALTTQAGIDFENICPSRCDHPGCGLHASFVTAEGGKLIPLSKRSSSLGCTSAARNREFIGSRWQRDIASETPDNCVDLSDMDTFIRRVKSHGFVVSAMAFQDAMNLDIERLRRCSLHVFSEGKLKPFCAAYLTATGEN